jgi:flagellar basal-body rod modification protein FlgD
MSTIPAFNPTAEQLRPPGDNRFSEMSSEDFIQIIFTELSNQDPFQPNDSGALLEQLNSIRSIESDLTMMDQLQTLVVENQLASAANLIGKAVSGLTADALPVEGTVASVVRENNSVLLELDTGHRVPMESVTQIVQSS